MYCPGRQTRGLLKRVRHRRKARSQSLGNEAIHPGPKSYPRTLISLVGHSMSHSSFVRLATSGTVLSSVNRRIRASVGAAIAAAAHSAPAAFGNRRVQSRCVLRISTRALASCDPRAARSVRYRTHLSVGVRMQGPSSLGVRGT